MRRAALLALAACIACGSNSTPPAGCQSNADCTAPAVCDKTQTPAACVTATTCIPACGANKTCDTTQSPPQCIGL